MSTSSVRARLRAMADPGHAVMLRRFFRTGPGEYGEGDRFIGVRVPAIRELAREAGAGFAERDILALLRSAVHEERLLALVLLIGLYERGDSAVRARVFRLYMKHRNRIDNWDLVDISAPAIVGAHLAGRGCRRLDRLARSGSLWDRRIAMVACFAFIRRGEFDDALRIADILLRDREDLIRKAVGWMLREIGKRDAETEERFLRERYRRMPRTMLRYAIERFPPALRRAYMEGRA